MTSLIDLRPNQDLLDPEFNGYRLSLDPVVVNKTILPDEVDTVLPSSNQFSFLHSKLFSLHNHLYVNQYTPTSTYLVNKKWKIQTPVLNSIDSIVSLRDVCEIPSTGTREPGHYNVSMSFASEGLVVISDGGGTIHIANIDNTGPEIWKIIQSDNIFDDNNCVIVATKLEDNILHTVGLCIEEKQNKDESHFVTVLDWVVLIQSNDTWVIKGRRKLECHGSVDFVAVEPGGESLYIVASKGLKFVYDSENPVVVKAKEEKVSVKKVYSWMQRKDDVTIWFQFGDEVKKDDLQIKSSPTDLCVACNERIILSGNFLERIDSEMTTWTFEKQKLEIQLTKHEPGLMWRSLIPGNEEGEEILDLELVAEVHQRLAHLCSETEENTRHISLTNEMEECDAGVDTAVFTRMSVGTHASSHEVSLATTPYLFHINNPTPILAFRHDVDACLWQFHEPVGKDWTTNHVGTISAFGYVQASKNQRKYLAAAPNFSYAAIIDTNRNVYIYHKPDVLETDLRNRRTGQQVKTVAKQQVVSLDNVDEVLGVQVFDRIIILLSSTQVYVLKIRSE